MEELQARVRAIEGSLHALAGELHDIRLRITIGLGGVSFVLTLFSILAAVLLGVFIYEAQGVRADLSSAGARLDRLADQRATDQAAANARMDRLLDLYAQGRQALPAAAPIPSIPTPPVTPAPGSMQR